MDKRIGLWIVLSVLILVGSSALNRWIAPPPVPNVAKAKADEKEPKKAPAKEAEKAPAAGKENNLAAVEGKVDKPEATIDPQWFTAGGLGNEQKMLLTFTNRGAALERAELTDYADLEDHLAFGMEKNGPNGEKYLWNRAGYLGHLSLAPGKPSGALVNVVGPGTPAAKAGLKAGDIIVGITAGEKNRPIANPLELNDALQQLKPETEITLDVLRGAARQKLSALLAWPPAQVIRPELKNRPLPIVVPGKHDPFSLGLHLANYDDASYDEEKKQEIADAKLTTAFWQGKQIDPQTVEFTRDLPGKKLQVIKRYHLHSADDAHTGYEVGVEVEIKNLDGEKSHKVAYQLNGPNGLPIEGWWYAFKNRISTDWWQGVGLRDMAYRQEGSDARLVGALDIVNKKADSVSQNEEKSPLFYAGTDCQYFAAVLIPRRDGQKPWLARIEPQLVGESPVLDYEKKLANVGAKLISKVAELEQAGGPGDHVKHSYDLFIGPKQPALLERVTSDPVADVEPTNLQRLFYLGWPIFSYPAHIMLTVLHFFHRFIPNYGINIIMLTVLVRSLMFPLSRKQALSAMKMQELQPQMKALNDKYKDKPDERGRAIQKLFRDNNYNPFGGCLMAFIQLPIFMGLYRALMIDPELRAAPLLGESIRWCSNLGAPDMLWYWEPYLPAFLSGVNGYLGPYLNVFPLVTVGLFLVQQKQMMPPATDDQSAMQQKMMKYMTVLMGLMFYNVACGLCLYFTASSIWGMIERKLIKKVTGYHPGQVNPFLNKENGGNNDKVINAKFSTVEDAKAKRKKQRDRR